MAAWRDVFVSLIGVRPVLIAPCLATETVSGGLFLAKQQI
jgi:hypothetical protein